LVTRPGNTGRATQEDTSPLQYTFPDLQLPQDQASGQVRRRLRPVGTPNVTGFPIVCLAQDVAQTASGAGDHHAASWIVAGELSVSAWLPRAVST